MAEMTRRTTFTLDEPTAIRLKRLALRWQVSQAEVVRRSVLQADNALNATPDIEQRIQSARLLRESIRKRNIDIGDWIKTASQSRR